MSFEDRKEILTIEGRGYILGEEFKSASSSLAELTYVDDTTLIPPKTYWRPWKRPTYQKGLFAKKDIRKGTLIGVYEGMVVTLDHVSDQEEEYCNVEIGADFECRATEDIRKRDELSWCYGPNLDNSHKEIDSPILSRVLALQSL